MSMDDWLNQIISQVIWSVRCRRRNDKSQHRIEITLTGKNVLTLLLTSDAPISASLHRGATSNTGGDWSDDAFQVAADGPPDNQEIKDLFHKLWSAAGTPHYDKKEWMRLAQAFSERGYQI